MAVSEDELSRFSLFASADSGISDWIDSGLPSPVVKRLAILPACPLNHGEFLQLILSPQHDALCSEGFFRYYWLSEPEHFYSVSSIPGYSPQWRTADGLVSIDQLYWGLYRFFVDALLCFGDIDRAYQALRAKGYSELEAQFGARRYDPQAMAGREPILPLIPIPKDDRYLISELAIKSHSGSGFTVGLRSALRDAYSDYRQRYTGPVTVRELIQGSFVKRKYGDTHFQLRFAADELLDDAITTEQQLEARMGALAARFDRAYKAALANTLCFLSSIDDLDVYIATSMRTRHDFRATADLCHAIFSAEQLEPLRLRHFDPTLSAAEGHEEKGLIECMMVRAAKALVYVSGSRDSYGKDAEAAMALSLGKPVIFFCHEEQRRRFFRDVHPLSRIVAFDSGVATGAIVTSSVEQVSEILYRLFNNQMVYQLEQPKPGQLRLKESLTGSVVRVQVENPRVRRALHSRYRPPTM